MPIFALKGIDKSGAKIERNIDASDKDSLINELSKTGFTIISLSEKKELLDLSFLKKYQLTSGKVKIDDLVMFSVQLSNMLGAGMPLPVSLTTLIEQTDNKKLKAALTDISEKIRGGKTFSESLAEHKNIFSNLFINMVAAGEAAGNLEEILSRLASFVEHEASLRQKIAGAMVYPVILMIAGILVISFVITSVIPPFVKIFMESGVPLPGPTKVLYNINLIIRKYWLFICSGTIIFWISVSRYGKTQKGKTIIDNIKLKIPLWGNLLRKAEIARMCRTFSALLTAGVPMLQAIDITEKTIDVSPLAVSMKNSSFAVGKGETISRAFKESGQFPPMVIQMIAVGEETGTLEKMLNKIADFYDLATDYAIKKLTTLLEPIFLVIIGGAVGFIFASILLPIFKMINVIKH